MRRKEILLLVLFFMLAQKLVWFLPFCNEAKYASFLDFAKRVAELVRRLGDCNCTAICWRCATATCSSTAIASQQRLRQIRTQFEWHENVRCSCETLWRQSPGRIRSRWHVVFAIAVAICKVNERSGDVVTPRRRILQGATLQAPPPFFQTRVANFLALSNSSQNLTWIIFRGKTKRSNLSDCSFFVSFFKFESRFLVEWIGFPEI